MRSNLPIQRFITAILAIIVSGCANLSLEQILQDLTYDVGQTNKNPHSHEFRLRVDSSGHGTSAVIAFSNSGQDRTTLVVRGSAEHRVTLTPERRYAARVRASVTSEGADVLTASLDGGNTDVVMIRVTARSVGNPGENGDVLTVSADRHYNAFPVWIEPAEGRWLPGINLGIVAVHAALMRQGQAASVLMFSPPRVRVNGAFAVDHSGHGGGFVWGYGDVRKVEIRELALSSNVVTDRPMVCPRNIFCSGHAHLSNGTLLVAGGHIHQFGIEDFGQGIIGCPGESISERDNVASRLQIYSPFPLANWRVHPMRMHDDRWYPTVTALPDGRMLITSGSDGTLGDNPLNTLIGTHYYEGLKHTYELFDPVTDRLVTPATENDFITAEFPETYPGVYVLPAGPNFPFGAVFAHERNRGWVFHYSAGTTQPLTREPWQFTMAATIGNRSYPHYGSSVLLPLEVDSSTARVLLTGGQDDSNSDHRDQSETRTATSTSEIFDYRADAGVSWIGGFRRIAHMARARFLHDATLLPDGQVLISGGAQRGWSNRNSGDVLDAELFDPVSEQFRLAAHAVHGRRYHSTALLLPDGTVMKAGSTGGFGAAELTVPVFVSERYLPPYLWRNFRPVLVSTSTDRLRYSSTVDVVVNSGAMDQPKFSLMRLGSVTHGNDMDQRHIWLPVRRQVNLPGNPRQTHFTLATPRDGSIAPPGDYMLFSLDRFGVPSLAHFVNLN